MSAKYMWREIENNVFEEDEKVYDKPNASVQLLSSICEDTLYTWRLGVHSFQLLGYEEMIDPAIDHSILFLLPLRPILKFDIDEIDVKSHMVVYCLLWGAKGAAIAQIPPPPFRDDMTAYATVLGEEIHSKCSKLNIVSAKQSIDEMKRVVVILYNDKYIRIYDAVSGEIIEVICASNSHNVPLTFDMNGDVADIPVDFDFGPNWPKSKFWTIFILRPTGDIQYFLVRILNKSKRCITQEFHPISHENPCIAWKEGERATGVLCISESPIMFAIACNTGVVLTSILIPRLENETDCSGCKERADGNIGLSAGTQGLKGYPLSDNKCCNLEKRILENNVFLTLKERMITKSKTVANLKYTRLIKDPKFGYRYLFLNDYGALLITINLVAEFNSYIANAQSKKLSLKNTSPDYQLVMVWDLTLASASGRVVTAATFSDSLPQSILFVRSGFKVSVRGLPKPWDHMPVKKGSSPAESASLVKGAEGLKEPDEFLYSFVDCFKKHPFPLLNMEEQAMKEKSIRLYVAAALDYSVKSLNAFNEASCVIDAFTVRFDKKTTEIIEQIMKLLSVKTALKDKAELLAEKYEERLETDESFKKRIAASLNQLSHSNPVVTDKERSWTRNLGEMNDEMTNLKTVLRNLIRTLQLAKDCTSDDSSFYICMTPTQLDQIKEELTNQHAALVKLANDIRQIKEYAYWQNDTTNNY